METKITIDASQVEPLLAMLQDVPTEAASAIVRGISRGSQLLLGIAVRERFSGKGPFPVSQNKLGVRSGHLRRSLRFTRPQSNGDGSFTVLAGSNVSYFAVHEFGFDGNVSIRAASVKASTNSNAFGNNSFSILAHTRRAHSRRMKIPKRAPLTTAINEHSTRVYVTEIAKELDKLLN
jgi:phage gpG-like protein